jgi:uncharacterized protein
MSKGMNRIFVLVLLAIISAPSVSFAKPKKGSVDTDHMPMMMAREPTVAERAEMRVHADKEYAALLPVAEQGGQAAQIRLSELQAGNCSCFNEIASQFWLEKAANAGSIEAQTRIAEGLYQNGQGSAEASATALKWYLKAAELGDMAHHNQIGRIYYFGQGTAIDYGKAASWFQKGATQNDRDAVRILIGMYLDGKGVPKDETKAFALQMKLATGQNSCKYYFEGCPQLGLAQMYYFGTGVTKNAEQAAAWYLKAAEADSIDGQLAIGFLFDKGEGIKEDKRKAAFWRSKAIAQLSEKATYDTGAQIQLGRILQDGFITPKDDKRSVFLLSKAGKYGSLALGKMYEEGRYVPQDLEQAVRLYGIASKAGIDVATRLLAETKYADVKLFEPTEDIAVFPTWLMRQNAEQGDAQAQFRMGGFYLEGQLVRADERIALGWFEMAAAQGHMEAKAALTKIGKPKP